MPRPLLPDDSGEALSKHMICLAESLKLLQDSAREAILKRQVRNMREYNKRKAVVEHGHEETFFVGDMVWVKNANPRKNKLENSYDGPYYITKFVEQNQVVELSMDGHKYIVRSVEHISQYHRTGRFAKPREGETSDNSESRENDLGVYPEKPLSGVKSLHLKLANSWKLMSVQNRNGGRHADRRRLKQFQCSQKLWREVWYLVLNSQHSTLWEMFLQVCWVWLSRLFLLLVC